MKKIQLLLVLFFICYLAFTQDKAVVNQENLVFLSEQEQGKILSGLLIEKVRQKQLMLKSGSITGRNATTNVLIYLSEYPDGSELRQLSQLGIKCFPETWTPAVGNHPLGYVVVSLPVDKLREALSLPFIKKMDTAERKSTAMNNNAVKSVKANIIWAAGYRGSGVKIGILDSGIDISYAGSDLPETFEYKDYSNYPELDDNVANTVTGHGTHVTATALGRGVLSAGKSPDYNGEGSFAGAAPDASLTFLKIGNDTNASASDAAIIAAIDAAINVYNVDVLSMSYGGWDYFHDGTSALEQKVDWAYNQGVPFFLSAGNSADDNKHWLGIVDANTESDFVELGVSNADTNDTRLRFNLVWSDGANRNDLTLKYYNSAKNPVSDIIFLPTTESRKGTESQLSYTNFYVPAGNNTYFLKVVNNSSYAQECHIFEDWSNLEEGNEKVSLVNSDPSFTIGSPASADYGFAVGAYVTRDHSFDYLGNSWSNTGYINDSLALFSSWGPRMDGAVKPDICAPGSMILSLRDKDTYKEPDRFWIDNDGVLGAGEVNYFRMHGTSMACPVVAGCAALYLEQKPDATPLEIYTAMKEFSNTTGLNGLPNNKWGAGKLNIANIFNLVELLSPPNGFEGISPNPTLCWADVANAISYNIQVSASEDFSAPVINLTGIDTNLVVVEGLEFNSTYFWRVQCTTVSATSGWSGAWSFTTGTVPTEAGYALWFDGLNDYVAVPHSSAIDDIEDNDAITVEAWVNIEKWSAGLFPIIEKYQPSIDWGWSFQLHNSSGMELGLIWSSVNQPTIPTLKNWNHVSVSYKKSEGKARFYLNGNLAGEKDFSEEIPDSGVDDPLYIGFNASGGNEYSSGVIDELRIWKGNRTGTQIKDNMYNKLTGLETNLAAVFSFDEGKSFLTSDRSGNFENGVLKNGPIWVVSTIPLLCAAPMIGTITHPTCTVATGSVVLNGLPVTGTWTLTKTPGAIITTGTGTSKTITGLTTGTHTFTVTNSDGCTSPASVNVVIKTQPTTPSAPTVGTITQPTCTVSTGNVILNGLPAIGTWTLTRSPDMITITGTGLSKTITGLTAGTYTFTVTNASGCTSEASPNVVINSQPTTPTTPIVSTITQPTCSVATGSVVLNGLPATGTWSLTRNPGTVITNGTGTSKTITGLLSGTYTYTVSNISGCTSVASANIIINSQPTIPTTPIVSTITQPTCSVATGSVVLNGLPATGTWSLTRNPGTVITNGTGTSKTITGLLPGTYTYTVTNISGCTSVASANIIINSSLSTPPAPTVETITQPTCTVATGSVVLNGLPATGTWTLIRTPGTVVTNGTGTSVTIVGLTPGTYNYTVSNDLGCFSPASGFVVISSQQTTPTVPTVGAITQPNCTTATGNVILNGLPATGTWTLTRTPGAITSTGTGTSKTITGLTTGTYTYTVSDSLGCTSAASADIVINPQPTTITTPFVGTITQPTCKIATGSVVINGLPETGNWTLTRNPGTIMTMGTGTSKTITGLTTGTYTYTVSDASGCTSAASADIVINPQPTTPTTPLVGTITQPTCTIATGSVVLNGLPETGNWTLTRNPGTIMSIGTGTSKTITGLNPGTYTFTVSNVSGCTSITSASVVFNAQPETPTAPAVGTITHPTCAVATGSVVLNGLPVSGTWTLTRSPGAITSTGTGSSTTITGLPAGTFTFTVSSDSGCTSVASADVVINTNLSTPTAPTVGTITQPTCNVATGSVVLIGLPSAGWTLTRTPGAITTTGTGSIKTITGLTAGTFTFAVTNVSGCTSTASANVVVNAQPETPTTPSVGTITQPTCAMATGSVVLNRLPVSETWTLTRSPGAITTTGTGTSKTLTGLTAGTYTFTVTNVSGCISAVSSNVIVNVQPITPITPTITLNGNILHSDATSGNQWYNQNGLIIGAINQDYTVTSNGDYFVIVSLSGCSSDSSNIINVKLTGIESTENNSLIKIYPNPATNELIIEFASNTVLTDFEILNSIGQKIFAGKMFEKTVVQTSKFTPGIYLVRLKPGMSYEFKRFIKN